MIWAIAIIGFLVLWTVAAIWYFIANLGNKGAGQKLWEKILLAPIFVVVLIAEFKNRRNAKKKG